MKAGAIGHAASTSFFPSKNLGAAGDGGMVITSDEQKAQKLKVFRGHGAEQKYYHEDIGGNFRLDALQAAIVNVKLPHLDKWIEKRQRNAEVYRNGLRVISEIQVPTAQMPRHTFNSFVVFAQQRDALRQFLSGKEIDTQIYYPLPLHMQNCFEYLGYKEGDFPISENASAQTVALPMYPEMTSQMQEYVVENIQKFYTS